MRRVLPVCLFTLCASCLSIGPPPPPGMLAVEQQAWWERLRALCGTGHPGRLAERGSAGDRYAQEALAARFVRCPVDTVEIAFDVGPEQTRTWRVIRSEMGLRLRHLNAGADGSAEAPTGYGGITIVPGSARQQDFVADSATVAMLPPTRGNVWSLEIDPGRTFAYTLGRPGVASRFRVEFDLSTAPPRETPGSPQP